jgi:hypothetical protein
MKVIIAGSRNFNDYNLLKTSCDNLLTQFTNIEIVSGTARGADKLGERYAMEKGYSIKEFPANWSLGKSAGYIRNDEMAQYADMLIAFWDGTSKGTKHMIDLANKRSINVEIVNY